tara:strand:- start:962 stop:1540 length:579 start_codon:yes stop_codon:yes gene_type:complete
MTYAKPGASKLVISIGANIPSNLGDPPTTIAAIRPLIEKSIIDWNFTFNFPKIEDKNFDKSLSFKWAPLYETDPLSGITDQPKFFNTVLVVDGKNFSMVKPNEIAAINLMKKFLDLEIVAGRDRKNKEIFWGPRPLDIDFISWGVLQVNTDTLILPHPRLSERNFVLIPLSEVLSETQGKPIRVKAKSSWPE